MEEDSNVLMSMSRRIPTFLEEEATFLLLVSTTGLGSWVVSISSSCMDLTVDGLSPLARPSRCLLRESETE